MNIQEIAGWAEDKFNETSDEGAERLWAHVFIHAKQAQALESIARSLVQIAGDRENAGILPDMKTALQFLVLSDRRKED